MLLHQQYSDQQRAAAFQLALDLAPNHMFGSSGMYAVDGQAKPGDPPQIYREMAMEWGYSVVKKLTL